MQSWSKAKFFQKILRNSWCPRNIVIAFFIPLVCFVLSPLAAQRTKKHATFSVPQHSHYAALGPKVNWRSGPGPDHDITWCYESPGWPVVILKKYDNWYYIKDLLGTCGWVKGSMLRFKPTLIITNDIHLYTKAELTSRKKAKLQKGVIVRYVKNNDSRWLYVMIPEKNIHGWIPASSSWPHMTTPCTP